MNDTKDEKKKKSNNHFTVSLNQSNKQLYDEMKQLANKIGCKVTDLVWYGFQLVKTNPPTHFGLS